MNLESLYQLVGTQPSLQSLAQIYPSLMYAFQHPMEAIAGYTQWAGSQSNNQGKGEDMDYLGMAQKAITDIMDSLKIINSNIKGLYEEMEQVKQTQAEILAQQKELLGALKEVE